MCSVKEKQEKLQDLINNLNYVSFEIFKDINGKVSDRHLSMLKTYFTAAFYALKKSIIQEFDRTQVQTSETKLKRFINEITLLSMESDFENEKIDDLRQIVLEIIET